MLGDKQPEGPRNRDYWKGRMDAMNLIISFGISPSSQIFMAELEFCNKMLGEFAKGEEAGVEKDSGSLVAPPVLGMGNPNGRD